MYSNYPTIKDNHKGRWVDYIQQMHIYLAADQLLFPFFNFKERERERRESMEKGREGKAREML